MRLRHLFTHVAEFIRRNHQQVQIANFKKKENLRFIMEKMKIGIAVFFAAITFLIGMLVASENNADSQTSSGYDLPAYNTEARSADDIPIRTLRDFNNAIVDIAEPFLVEVVVRGYITGVTSTALWYRYSLGEREIYGYHFPEGLQKNARLPEPIITPTTKGGITGHDERLTMFCKLD